MEGSEVDALFSDPRFAERCGVLIGEEGAHGSVVSGGGAAALPFQQVEHLKQLHQWEQWRRERSERAVARGEAAWPALPEELKQEAREAFMLHQNIHRSHLQKQVVRTLRAMGVSAEEEVITGQGHSLDIVVDLEGTGAKVLRCPAAGGGSDGNKGVRAQSPAATSSGSLVAIEVDGPSHFLHRSQRPNGATHLKRRQLRQSGWRLVSVPYWCWSRSAATEGTTDDMRRAYLTELLGLPQAE